jgi:hypothetical protein
MADKTYNTSLAVGETDDPNARIESYEAAAGITKGSPVYLSADDKVSASPGGDNALGIATKTVLTGQMCPVLTDGRVKVKAGRHNTWRGSVQRCKRQSHSASRSSSR